MAETPPQLPASAVSDPELLQYWCYHCDKRVSIETLANVPDVICHECKNGFVEAITVTTASQSTLSSPVSINRLEEPSFSRQFLQLLRLIAQATRDDEAPPPPRPDPVSEPSDADDFLRIELNGWDNEDDDEDDVEFVNNDGDRSEDEIGDEEEEEEEEDEEDRRRRRRDILRLRIRDLASRATRERNRILDWSEILMNLGDNTVEVHVQMPDSDIYVGNPEDYVDAMGFEELLQNFAESDGGGRRGAPPAAKSAMEALQTVEVTSEECFLCAICKDSIPVGEKAKKLPCGHGYHGDCIVPWLESRNTCPVCRFELPTDDLEYEDERRKRTASTMASTGPSGTANSDGNNPVSG